MTSSWIEFSENKEVKKYRLQSENSFPLPKSIKCVDDRFTADQYLIDASQGISFVWKGDFQNAKQLLQAVSRRLDKSYEKRRMKYPSNQSLSQTFHLHRQAQHHKAQTLSRLLVVVNQDYELDLKRSPRFQDIIESCLSVDKNSHREAFVMSLKELLGMIGSYEWQKNGLVIPFLEERIFPKYGTFAPIRNEYLELVWNSPLNKNYVSCFDIGTGTGILSFLMAKRGIRKITSTDISENALACALENAKHIKLEQSIDFQLKDMFPDGKADLILCNPPWIPAKPTSKMEYAIYDEKGSMLKSFIEKLPSHLEENGEAWLIISDLAEILELRSKSEIPDLIQNAGLKLIEIISTRPSHKKSQDLSDPLALARSQEVTKLYRLKLTI